MPVLSNGTTVTVTAPTGSTQTLTVARGLSPARIAADIDDTTTTIGAAVERAGGILASSVDRANTATPLPLATFTPLGPRIAVPPTTRPVVLHYGASITCTTAGTGLLCIGVGETTTGSVVDVGLAWRYGTWVSTGTFGPLTGYYGGTIDLDASTTWRYYRLVGNVLRDSGSLAASVSASGSTNNRSPYLRAVLG